MGLVWNRPTDPFDVKNETTSALVKPLQEEVKKARSVGLPSSLRNWVARAMVQVKLALMNEILGRTQWASRVFGTQAPDTGNAEIIAHYGTPEQKQKYLEPLLGWRNGVLLFHDRTPGRLGPGPVQLPRLARG